MGKRSREGCPKWWADVEDEILSHGGHIHRSVRFCLNSRQLMLEDEVGKGTVLMTINSNSLVGRKRAKSLVPCLAKVEEKLLDRKKELHSSVADLLIAIALSTTKDYSLLPYLHTLPARTTFDSLPRRWDDTKVQKLLKGSPLLERIRVAREGIANDYRVLQSTWHECNEDATTSSFPSFSDFSDMLAAVSSRAFVASDVEGDVAMVPVLDLCDHYRGKGSKKNVSYKFLEDGSVEVQSAVSIAKNEVLRITYGAVGNGQLLFNYGFTIPRNLEPDGSSNDVLEMHLSGIKKVFLRTGPKSYTYGGLVQALELVTSESNGEQTAGHETDDMESFLDGCEDSEEFDIYGDAQEDEVEEEEDGDDVQRDLVCAKKLQEELQRRFQLYALKGEALKERISRVDHSSEFYASLLVQSEQRTIYFFTKALEKLTARLKNEPQTQHSKLDIVLDESDIGLIEDQSDKLVEAYMKIRHGDIK